jgi:hypothetical protein
MNQMLADAGKSAGAWYEFVTGVVPDETKRPSNK